MIDPLTAWFLTKTRREANGCLLWTGVYYTSRGGYGVFTEPKKFGGSGKNIRAHRWSYQRFVGDIPAGRIVMHRCDTPPCVEPTHLLLGTNKENVLAGRGPTAINARKQACSYGHQLSVEKRWWGERRWCRECHRRRRAERRKRKRLEVISQKR